MTGQELAAPNDNRSHLAKGRQAVRNAFDLVGGVAVVITRVRLVGVDLDGAALSLRRRRLAAWGRAVGLNFGAFLADLRRRKAPSRFWFFASCVSTRKKYAILALMQV